MRHRGSVDQQFAAHLVLLLDFHRDDEPGWQGLFEPSPVKVAAVIATNKSQALVTLENGTRLRVTVEVA